MLNPLADGAGHTLTFWRMEPGGLQRDGDAAALAVGVLLGQEPVDRLDGGELAALEAADRMVERLERARYAKPDQAGADAVEQLGHDTAPPVKLESHYRLPATAASIRCRRT